MNDGWMNEWVGEYGLNVLKRDASFELFGSVGLYYIMFLAGNGAYVFGDNGKNPKDIGLANEGSITGINYAKSWYEKWPKGMQDTEGS